MNETWAIKPQTISPDAVSETYDSDIVIIGAGHAGTCAARAAAEAGVSVIVLEQQERETQWVLGIGEIGHINSRWQKEHGIAAGDYSKNAEMCRYLLTETADLTEEESDFTGHGWDGSGICMGL